MSSNDSGATCPSGDAISDKQDTGQDASDTVSDIPQSANSDKHCDHQKDNEQTKNITNTITDQGENGATKELVNFKVVYNKKKYDVSFGLDEQVSSLRQHLETITGVPASMQKVMFKGKMGDDQTLRQHDVKNNAKIMLIGSTVTDVMSVSAPDPKQLKEEEKKEAAASKNPLSKQKPHCTVLEKHGKPDDVVPGVKNLKDRLPSQPLSGMYNKSGGKVRLTFKLEQDQLWISTKERTDKIPMGSIKGVTSEKIDGHEEYHLLAFQLGPTEASRYWVYWVPAQYVDAIKDSVLGKWQFF